MVKAAHYKCGYKWRCSTHKNYTRTVCSDSFLENSHLTLRQCLWLVYFWCLDIDLPNAMQMVGIGSKETGVDLYRRMRGLIEECFFGNPTDKLDVTFPYAHEIVVHNANIVDPDAGVHTQDVEACLSRVKKRLKQKNVMGNKDLLMEHMHKEMWRERFGGSDYDRI